MPLSSLLPILNTGFMLTCILQTTNAFVCFGHVWSVFALCTISAETYRAGGAFFKLMQLLCVDDCPGGTTCLFTFAVRCQFTPAVVLPKLLVHSFEMARNCGVAPNVEPSQVSFSWWDVRDYKCVRKRFFVFCHDFSNLRSELRFGADAKKAPHMLVLRAFDSDVWFWHVLSTCLVIEKQIFATCLMWYMLLIFFDFWSELYMLHVGPCPSNKTLRVCMMWLRNIASD